MTVLNDIFFAFDAGRACIDCMERTRVILSTAGHCGTRITIFPKKNDLFLINMTLKKIVQTIGKSLLQFFRSGVFVTEYRNDFQIRIENFRDKSPQRGMVIF